MNALDLLREIQALRQEMREALRQRVANVVRFGKISKQSADGYADEQEGFKTTAAEQGGGYGYLARRLWPFGIRSVPPTGVDSVAVQVLGGSTNTVIVGAESMDYGPTDLETGETAIYNKVTGAVIKIDKDGKITIDAPGALEVVVNGGTAKVARVGDDVNLSVDLGLYLSAIRVAITGLGGPDVGAPPTHIGDIATGAARFKA